jgi:hypothetical protein
MNHAVARLALLPLLLAAAPCLAVDSYRYLHVTIETPWSIFVVLLLMMFVPYVLMVALMWRQARKARERAAARAEAAAAAAPTGERP